MHVPRVTTLSGCLALLGIASQLVSAQNAAPFTIRFPPDGATVREKVAVKIPLASIPKGGYVAFYVNDQFRVALAPTEKEQEDAKPGALYTYVWDTKVPMRVKGKAQEQVPQDGEYTITAKLYVPGSERENGTSLKDTSSVTVKLANQITEDPGPLLLRYRYVDGSERTYDRKGVAAVVAGLSQGMKGTGDIEFGAETSELVLAVHDVYPNNHAIVRNMLQKLTVRQNGQETTYPTSMLPRALFQEVTPSGQVVYQNENVTFNQFENLGVPISPTLELPPLPEQAVRVGDTWRTQNVRIDIPGVGPDKEPVVSAETKLVGLEWEGGYPTAKIVQTYDSAKQGGFNEKVIQFGPYIVESPQIKFERTIYFAYRSGTLVRIDRKLEVTGKTEQGASTGATIGGMGYQGAPPPGMMMGGSSMPPGLMGGSGMPPGMMSGSMMPPGMMGGSGMPPGMMGGSMMPPGMGSGAMMPGGVRGQQRRGTRSGGMMIPGMGSGVPYGGSSGYSPMGMRPGAGTGYTGAAMGGTTGPVQITLKSTTTTELEPGGKGKASTP